MSKRKYFNYLDVKSLLDKMLSTEIKDEERQLDTAQAIKELSKGIKHLRKQGYTFAQIESFFKESGLDISRRTIESYISPKKTSQSRKSGATKEPDRADTNLQENPTKAMKNEESLTEEAPEEIAQEESSSIEKAVTDIDEAADSGRLEETENTQKTNIRPGRFAVRPDTIDL